MYSNSCVVVVVLLLVLNLGFFSSTVKASQESCGEPENNRFSWNKCPQLEGKLLNSSCLTPWEVSNNGVFAPKGADSIGGGTNSTKTGVVLVSLLSPSYVKQNVQFESGSVNDTCTFK